VNHSDKILLFDGICNLCNGLVRFIIIRDRHARIRFVPLQAVETQYIASLHVKFDLVREDMETVIYISSDKIYFKSSAVLHLLRDLGGGWNIFYGLIIIPKFIRDLFYDLIAWSRYRVFGKRDTCMIPAPEIKERFIF